MTREEARIKLIEIRAQLEVILSMYGLEISDVFDIAIKALQQEPCEDCISRAEAMTEIMMFAGNVKSDEEDIYIKVSDAVQLLRELPPANLQESKYCDRDICTKNEYNGIGCDECEVTKSQKPKTEWIPVSERLPENSGNYLITYCLRDKIETQEAVYAKDEEDKWFDITDIEITLAVIAWMPLPEPYKAERNDKE